MAPDSIDSIVLDLCCGSGSTAVACASLGIASISVDKRKNQITATKERLLNTQWSLVDGISHHLPQLIPKISKTQPKNTPTKNQLPKTISLLEQFSSTDQSEAEVLEEESQSSVLNDSTVSSDVHESFPIPESPEIGGDSVLLSESETAEDNQILQGIFLL